MTDLAIETHQLSVAYASKPVLLNVNVKISAQGMTAIIGPNGAGKSTLLKAILGNVPLLSGSIEYHRKIQSKADVGYVPQRSSVDWDFPTTVLDLVTMGTYGRLKWFQRPGQREKEKAIRSLEQVGMQDLAHRQIGELSGGQQQRVFLARAFAQEPSICILDEPFAGIDAASEKLIVDLLHQLRDSGVTIVLVHHDLSTVAAYFDHVVMLNRHVIDAGCTSSTFTSKNIERTYGGPGRATCGCSDTKIEELSLQELSSGVSFSNDF